MDIQWNKEAKHAAYDGTHSLFVDNPQIYQESHQKLEVVNEMIMKASMDTGACSDVKIYAGIIFRKGKMIKGEAILEDKMNELYPNENEICKYLGCKQAHQIDIKQIMERVKK